MTKRTPAWKEIGLPLWAVLHGVDGRNGSRIESLLSGSGRFSIWWRAKWHLPYDTMVRYVRRHKTLCVDARALARRIERRHRIKFLPYSQFVGASCGIGFLRVDDGLIVYHGHPGTDPNSFVAKMAADGRDTQISGPIKRNRLAQMDPKLREATILSIETKEVLKWLS